ncbi:MAG: rhamnan synthesis F family protein [Lachnospiraceae bacterium]
MRKKRRLGIYFFYDEKGIARDFVLKFVEGLEEVCDTVWIVVNGILDEESQLRLKKIEPNIWVRDNVGFDVWAYKTMMERLGWNYIHSFDELVLCNFTCYGPIYPFHEMFDKMDGRQCDFWGAVRHPEQPVYLLPNKEGYIYEHLMSYFIVIKERMLKSEDFKTYWDYVPEIHTKRESTAYHETVFTKYFEDRGYKSDSYVDLGKYKERCYNSSIILANELLIKDRCPLVKRRAFFFPEYEALLNISMADQAVELMEYIDKNTDYDTSLIWQDILQTQKMSLVHTNMHLVEVLSSKSLYRREERKNKILYFIYVPKTFYADILQKYINARIGADNYIILYSEDEVGNYCKEILGNNVQKENIRKINIISNRVTLSCMREYRKEIQEADYTCCILNYNVVQQALRITEEDFVTYTYECLLKNWIYVENVVAIFEKNRYLGMLVPSEADFAVYYSQNITKNRNNLEKNKGIYEQLKLDVPFDDGAYYNNQSSFWIKREAAVELFEELDNKEAYDILFKTNSFDFFLPMYIQQAGYYVATLLPAETAAVDISQQHYMKHKLIDSIEKKNGHAFWRFWDLLNDINKRDVETRTIYVHSKRDEVLNTHFSFREILSLIAKYPAHKIEYMKQKKAKKAVQKYPIYTYLRNVSIEGKRLVLYFMSGKQEINKSYILVNGRRYYSKKDLSNGQKELVKYVKDYSGSYAAFFEIPMDAIKNQLLSLFEDDGKQTYFKWASGISYNALELSNSGLYSRMIDKGYLIQTKKEFISGVLKSKQYSFRDKIVFWLMSLNKIHKVTLMSENLSAADNTFQLYKHCIDCGEKVYYLVSQKVYDSEKESRYKKRMVVHNSRKHHWLIAFSKRWITSFSLRLELFPTSDFYKDIHYNMLPPNWIFIPHGMAVGDKSVAMLYKYAWDNPRMTYTSSEAECLAYANMYGFQNVTYLGSPRMDKWKDVEINEHEVFIFFTWRLGLSKGRKSYYDSFEESDYYKTIVEIVKEVRSHYPEYIINYAFHHEVVKLGYDAIIKKALETEQINFIYLNSIDGAEEFNVHFGSAKYLITDFSSVAYDFSYKDDAIAIYYLENNFIKYHYELEPAFFDIHLGLVTKNKSELVNALRMKKPTAIMQERRQSFFYQNDNKNSERVYRAIFKGEHINQYYNKTDEIKPVEDKKRLGIYFFFDESGVVDNYVYYYLQELRKQCKELCVVVNGNVQNTYRDKLIQYSDKLIIRENIGFDSWAYREAIEEYGYDYIAENYDEVILNNFTNFGPIYSFEEMFSVMDMRECDFWGHNRYHAQKGQRFEDVPMVDHLQSYFTVFRKGILKSPYFKQYWKTLQCPKTYVDAIKFHEIRYTKYFEELGFISSEYIPMEAYSAICNNAPMYMAYSQMINYHSPFLKRKIFFIQDGKFAFPLREEASVYDLIKYVNEETSYDVQLIYENIARTQNLEQETSHQDQIEIEKEYSNLLKEADTEQKLHNAYSLKNQVYEKVDFLRNFEK